MKFRLLSDQFKKKKKTWIYYGQMADAEFNFRQCSVLSEFHTLQTFWSLSILYTQLKFSTSITSIYTDFKQNGMDLIKSKWTIQEGGWFQFLLSNKWYHHYTHIYVLANFLILSDSFPF